MFEINSFSNKNHSQLEENTVWLTCGKHKQTLLLVIAGKIFGLKPSNLTFLPCVNLLLPWMYLKRLLMEFLNLPKALPLMYLKRLLMDFLNLPEVINGNSQNSFYIAFDLIFGCLEPRLGFGYFRFIIP